MTDSKFSGTSSYIATDDLRMAVNAAVTLERPILVKGEPGTGKTQLAVEVARALGKPLHEWHIKSTTKAQQGLYEYDAVARLRDSQLGDDRVHDIANYIVRGKVWEILVVAVASYAVFAVMGLKYAMLLGVLVVLVWQVALSAPDGRLHIYHWY